MITIFIHLQDIFTLKRQFNRKHYILLVIVIKLALLFFLLLKQNIHN